MIKRSFLVPTLLLLLLPCALSFTLEPLNARASSTNSKAKLKEPTAREIRLPEFDPRYIWDLSKVAFSLLPLYPSNRRKTLQEEVVPNTIWTLDQLQGIINVNVPVRAVVVRLKRGGLLVYNPVAPTQECVEYIRALEAKYGAVKYIVLGTLGLEHKGFAGPFSSYFPTASIWLQPGQWAFPVNLPNIFLGFPANRLNIIPNNNEDAPWSEEFDHAVLGPLKFKSVGGFGETAMFHKETKTLLVTDTVVKIADKPSPILEDDPRALLFHSKDDMLQSVQDTDEARLRGWRRMALFSLTFYPGGIDVMGILETLRNLPKVSSESALLGKGVIPISGGLYPWRWARSELPNFKSLQRGLLVAPILRELILNREPDAVLSWVERVSKWPIKRIIPSHLENNIKGTGQDFKNAFQFLRKTRSVDQSPGPLPEDLKLLRLLSDVFTKLGVVAPPV